MGIGHEHREFVTWKYLEQWGGLMKMFFEGLAGVHGLVELANFVKTKTAGLEIGGGHEWDSLSSII